MCAVVVAHHAWRASVRWGLGSPTWLISMQRRPRRPPGSSVRWLRVPQANSEASFLGLHTPVKVRTCADTVARTRLRLHGNRSSVWKVSGAVVADGIRVDSVRTTGTPKAALDPSNKRAWRDSGCTGSLSAPSVRWASFGSHDSPSGARKSRTARFDAANCSGVLIGISVRRYFAHVSSSVGICVDIPQVPRGDRPTQSHNREHLRGRECARFQFDFQPLLMQGVCAPVAMAATPRERTSDFCHSLQSRSSGG
jgi:hypothetical protein